MKYCAFNLEMNFNISRGKLFRNLSLKTLTVNFSVKDLYFFYHAYVFFDISTGSTINYLRGEVVQDEKKSEK